MEPVFCVVVGLFFAASIYLMLSPHLVRILLGVSILGNAVNLLIFTAGRLTEAAPPVLAATGAHAPETRRPPTEPAPQGDGVNALGAAPDGGASALPTTEPIAPSGPAADGGPNAASDLAGQITDAFSATANPLPQALILTAIVISFSIFAFLLVLAFRASQALDTDSIDDMRAAEPEAERPPFGY